MHFKKAILKPGTYRSPDGEVVVDAARLRHWAKEFARMTAASQVVPIDWDHSQDEAKLQPLSLADYETRRSAKNTVGHLVDMKVADDGGSAEITLDIRDSAAVDKAAKNLVYVSPVIFPSWKDGAGNEYRDCLTHVDLVNHPVDHSQGPFSPAIPGAVACAIRMGISKPLRMAGEAVNDDDDKTKDGDGDGKIGEGESGNKLKDVLEALAAMDIVLSDDTTAENFLAHLHQALLTAAAHRGEGPADAGGDSGKGETKVADPGIAALSLEARGAIAWAENTHRQAVQARLRMCLEEGRCTPAEFQARKGDVAAIRLSLGTDGNPSASELEKWLDSRDPIPKGTFWDPDVKLQRLSAVAADPPLDVTGRMSDDDAKKMADWALGRKT